MREFLTLNKEEEVPYIGVGIDWDREGLVQAMKEEQVQKQGVKKASFMQRWERKITLSIGKR